MSTTVVHGVIGVPNCGRRGVTPAQKFQLAANKMWQLIHEGELDSREIADQIGVKRDAVRAVILGQRKRLCEVCYAKGTHGTGKTCGSCAGLGALGA